MSDGIDGVIQWPGGWGCPWWKTGESEQRLGVAELARRGSPFTLRYAQLGQGGGASESEKVIPREVTGLWCPALIDPHHRYNLHRG